MCGIAGIIALNSNLIDMNRAKQMCDIIAHRGPDGAGYLFSKIQSKHAKTIYSEQLFTEDAFLATSPTKQSIQSLLHGSHLASTHFDVFMGHRRLAIIDLSEHGFQPMSDQSRMIWVVFNGEIYNFKSIRLELKKLGYQFKSNTDTEVIINAYLEYGVDFIHKLNGMFAIALYDKIHGQFYLFRDRYGVKPLYYMISEEGYLLFGSEIKAILAYLKEKPKIDKEAVVEYFTFQNIFTDKTFHQNIQLLKPGYLIHLNLNQEKPFPTQAQYFDFAFSEAADPLSLNESAEELEMIFKRSVERQLVSDVEVGSYLSGGMDSGAITAVASNIFPYLKTFTVGFDLNNISGIELSYDEREKAEMLSYICKTEHYEMVLKSGDMERCLPKFSWHLEEPRIGQSYPNYYAAKLASKFVKVVMSGTGGDELFAGYPWRYYQACGSQNYNEYIDHYYNYWQRLIPQEKLSSMLAPIWQQVSHVDTKDIFNSVFNRHVLSLDRPEDYINHSLYFEFKTFLHGLLVVEDKLSMAHSLETRVPFLDNELFDFAIKLPVKYKLGDLSNVIKINENEIGSKARKHFAKTNNGKTILRNALSHILPREFTHGIKQGFSSPDASWFKGDSINFVKNLLENNESPIYAYFDYPSVQQELAGHLNGQENKRLFIWSLINFHYFLINYG